MDETEADISTHTKMPEPTEQIPSSTTTPEQEPTEHHKRVAKLYNIWLQAGGLNDGRVGVYTPENFNGNWQELGPEEYFIHQLSVLRLEAKY